MNGVVKKHELTREDKEQDRIHHVDSCNANTGPIFLACRYPDSLLTLMNNWKDHHEAAYDFTEGCKPAGSAKQINMILIHTSCVVCRDKYSYIKLFTPGTDSRTADGYIYQNRCYGDLFLLEKKADGCAMNVDGE